MVCHAERGSSSPDNARLEPQVGTGASVRLEAIKRARQRSASVVLGLKQVAVETGSASDDTLGSPVARTVDIRMYEALAASRNRMSRKMSELQRKNRAVQDVAHEKDVSLVKAYSCLAKSAGEFDNLSKLCAAATAGVQFGVDREQALEKLLRLQERLEVMQEVVRQSQSELGELVVHSVPVVWTGIASEVRLMGDFDGWGDGYLLSSESFDDHIFSRFEGNITLKPGRYLVKFLVDGEWRLAPDWPTQDVEGDTNNVLVVENDLFSVPTDLDEL